MRIERGVVSAFDATAHTADVVLMGSIQRLVAAVPVSHQIGAELMEPGADCAVVFFAPGDAGVVVATFGGAPDPWVTSALIKDGEVDFGDLAFSLPAVYLVSTAASQALTTTATKYSALGQQVVVSSGTWRVHVVGQVELENAAFTGWNNLVVQVSDGAMVGQPGAFKTQASGDRATVTVAVAAEIQATKTYDVLVNKALSRNTENAVRGNLSVVAWQVG